MKTLIIDSNNLCYRALIIRGAREIAGQEVAGRQKEIILSVIQGFLVQLRKLASRYEPSCSRIINQRGPLRGEQNMSVESPSGDLLLSSKSQYLI
jgi:hypothetical protein